VWAAKNSDVPVAVRVASFGALDGLIVSLTDKGKLSLLYLGTDSPTSSVVTPQGKTVGLAEMDEELIQNVYDHMLESIAAQTKNNKEGHFALKLTALIPTDTMTRLSRAQQVYMNDILNYDK
jgi:hypothetical protein